MPKYIIKTLGCKVNQFESEAISQLLTESGFKITHDGDAHLCIINTCTVTGKASMQSRQAIRQLIRDNQNARIVVTGCYAQTEPEIIKQIHGVHDVVPNSNKHKISDLITSEIRNTKGPLLSKNAINKNQDDFFFSPSPVFGHRTRPFLKIQDGCDAFCSYCIIPYARGRSKSMPFDMVLENIKNLNDAGSLEVVLTGIHLGAYGLDLTPPLSLFELLHALNEHHVVKRLRLSSIEPNELNNEIIKLVKTSDMICNHFHIPLQSGNDGILKKMNRPYNRLLFERLIQTIHASIPEVSIGVDVIIGFPGETKHAFETTYSLIHDLPVSYLHVFPFSPRQGTPASKRTDKVSTTVITKRAKSMRELGNVKKTEFYHRFIGRTVEILIESSRDKKTGNLKGLTSNYIPVLLDGPDLLKNKLVHVKIETMNKNLQLIGRVMN